VYDSVPVPLFHIWKLVDAVTPSILSPKSCEVGLYDSIGAGGITVNDTVNMLFPPFELIDTS